MKQPVSFLLILFLVFPGFTFGEVFQAEQRPTVTKPTVTSPDIDQITNYLTGQTLSLSQAVRLCLTTNHTIALARANLYVAQGKTSEAYAALNPTLGSALDVIRLNEPVVNKGLITLDPKNFDNPIGAEITNSNIQQKLVGVTAQLPIDISGSIHVASEQAKFQEQAYRQDLDRTRNQVIGDVKGAFFAALRAEALEKVAEESLKNSQDRLHDATSKFGAKVVTRFDVLRAQTDLAVSQQNLIVAKNTVRTYLATLNLILGIQVTTDLQLTEEGAIQIPSNSGMLNPQADGKLGPEFDADLKEALANRPEIKEATFYIEAAQKGITLARRSELPSFNLSFSYLYAPNAGGTSPLINTWQAQAVFSVPIFDGGVARARHQEAQGNLSGAETLKRQTIDGVTLDSEQAFLALNEARQRVNVASQSLKQAQEAFQLAKVRYQAGVSSRAGISPLLELSDAQAALTLAESNQVNALYDFNSASARLDRALGRYATIDLGK